MRKNANRIKSLCETFASLLNQESEANDELLSALEKAIRTLKEETADPRLPRLLEHIRKLQERDRLFLDTSNSNFVEKVVREAEGLNEERTDAALGRVLMGLVRSESAFTSSSGFATALLDGLIAETDAQRGFMLRYLPESTEAEVLSARHFQTAHLSASEYGLSRTVLRRVLEEGKPVVLDDASRDPRFASATSIREWNLLSILAVPLKSSDRVIGAIYLDHQTLCAHFGPAEQQFLEATASFAVFYLRHWRLLPLVQQPKSSVFLDAARAPRELVGNHPKILEVLDVVQRIADKPVTVLIEGESGTGKELVARALHYQSHRSADPFVAINCAAIPRDLLESELFGHEKGAFTGATARFLGHISQADGGTLFLDEISELDYPLQAKLLRFLQSNEFQRLGSQEVQKVDVRIIAATSRNLRKRVEAGEFQAALYYRLHVVPIQLPALRERQEDIPALVEHFLDKYSRLYGSQPQVRPEVMDTLCAYSFPGNVRELENLVHRVVVLSTGTEITLADLPAEILKSNSHRISLAPDPLYKILSTPVRSLEDLHSREERVRQFFDEQRRQLGQRAVQEADGNVTAAAAKLGVHRATLHEMIKKVPHTG